MITINVRHAIFFIIIGIIVANVAEKYWQDFRYEDFKQSIVGRL